MRRQGSVRAPLRAKVRAPAALGGRGTPPPVFVRGGSAVPKNRLCMLFCFALLGAWGGSSPPVPCECAAPSIIGMDAPEGVGATAASTLESAR